MRKTVLIATMLLGVFAGVRSGGADEISDLKQQLAEQQKVLEQMQKKLEELEAKQQQQTEQMQEEITKAVEEKPPAVPDSLKWAEKIKLSGDFRFRYEAIDREETSATRVRNRIRARLRVDAKVHDEFDGIFRIATAEVDTDVGEAGLAAGSTSTNVTLTRELKQKNIWLDWAYGDYHPNYITGMNVLFGKMGTPFYKVAKHQLAWDNDLAWEGGAVNYKTPLNDDQQLGLHGGYFWLRERDGTPTTADTLLWTSQAAVTQKMDDMSLTGGAAYWHVANSAVAGYTALQRGHSATFDDKFGVVELFAEMGTKTKGGLPVGLYGVYSNNVRTSSDENIAWIIGAKLNKAKAAGSWELGYSYRDLQADSVTGLNDSDFIGGGTAGKGHEFKGKYQIHKHVQTALTFILAQRDRSAGDNLDYDRLMADIILKF
jgi:uncharacterized coiled-coil protein SlyX